MKKSYLTLCISVALLMLAIPLKLSLANGRHVAWGYVSRDKKVEKKDYSKIGPDIKKALDELNSLGITRENMSNKDISQISSSTLKINESGYIQVYVFVKQADQSIVNQLKKLGMKVETTNNSYKVVQGWLPFFKIEEISSLEFVIRITTPDYAFPRTGSINTEGDSVMASDEVREMFGITGKNVRVGVISDGVDNADSAQATGDLPDIIEVNPSLPGDGDEGTALLEIIYDIAPGADLVFSGAATNLEFIDAIDYMLSRNVDVIVDDLGFLGEPFFEDGPVAEKAKSAVQNGAVFISAAGNSAMKHYQHEYVDTEPNQDATQENPSADLHDFGLARGGSSDVTLKGLIAPGRSAVIVLQWNDDANGNTLDGNGSSSNDYDLIIAKSSNDITCTPDDCISNTFQNGDDDPIEAVSLKNSNMNDVLPFEILIDRFSGQAKILEIYTGSFSALQDGTQEDSVFGHPAVEGVIAVGAVPVTDTGMVEDFSSRGPSTIYFPSFEQRNKPDVVAPDNVSITGAGDLPSKLSGTSAAAPHVAGVAALMLEADPSLTPAELKQAILDTAVDINSTASRQADLQNALFNTNSGFGLIDAFSAVKSVLPDVENSCNDQVDNDGDGNVDCEDNDCMNASSCNMQMVELCDDGIDNDNDGSIDCADSQCSKDPACKMQENSNQGVGSSGGCSLSGSGEASSVNLVLLLLPLFLVRLGIRKLGEPASDKN